MMFQHSINVSSTSSAGRTYSLFLTSERSQHIQSVLTFLPRGGRRLLQETRLPNCLKASQCFIIIHVTQQRLQLVLYEHVEGRSQSLCCCCEDSEEERHETQMSPQHLETGVLLKVL